MPKEGNLTEVYTKLKLQIYFTHFATFSIILFVLNISRLKVWRKRSNEVVDENLITLPFQSVTSKRIIASESRRKQFDVFLKHLIDDYTLWHRHERKSLGLLRSNFRKRKPRLLVYRGRYKNAGIGDRIRGVLCSYLLAVLSKRLLLIDLNNPFPIFDILPSPNGQNFSFDHTLFSWHGEEEFTKYNETLSDIDAYLSSTRVIVLNSHPIFSMKWFARMIQKHKNLDFSQRLRSAGLENLDFTRDEVAPFILKAIFTPSNLLLKRVSAMMYHSKGSYLSLHARIGHGLRENHDRFNFRRHNMTLEQYSSCLEKMAVKKAKSLNISHFFIASDTRKAKKLLKLGIAKRFPGADVHISAINAIHASRIKSKTEKHFEEYLQCFVDIGLLSLGRSMLSIKSGFSNVAIWMGAMIDAKRVWMKECIINTKQ